MIYGGRNEQEGEASAAGGPAAPQAPLINPGGARMSAIANSRPRIVDADGHVLEHPTAMLDYMPERYKKRCFHVETDAAGTEWCFYDDLKMYANRMALAGAGGMTLEERQRALKGEMRYSDIRSGAFDPARRLVEMAQDDIE